MRTLPWLGLKSSVMKTWRTLSYINGNTETKDVSVGENTAHMRANTKTQGISVGKDTVQSSSNTETKGVSDWDERVKLIDPVVNSQFPCGCSVSLSCLLSLLSFALWQQVTFCLELNLRSWIRFRLYALVYWTCCWRHVQKVAFSVVSSSRWLSSAHDMTAVTMETTILRWTCIVIIADQVNLDIPDWDLCLERLSEWQGEQVEQVKDAEEGEEGFSDVMIGPCKTDKN